MGRPSSIMLTLVVERGKLDTVRIGGNAVRVAEGTMATDERAEMLAIGPDRGLLTTVRPSAAH